MPKLCGSRKRQDTFAEDTFFSFSGIFRNFQCFWKIKLRMISGTCRAGKNLKTDLNSAHQNTPRIDDFLLKIKIMLGSVIYFSECAV
jgi:hypothetical protein